MTKFDDTNHTKLKNFMIEENQGTYTVKKNQSNSNMVWDHPFKTSALLRGGGVKNLPNLPTDSSKKLPTVGG